MANNSNLSKRVALRQQQELEARRKRNARMLGVGLGVLALVVVVVIAVVIANAIGSKAPAAEQLTPPNATEGHGIAIKSKNTQPAGDVPNVVVYEDYQCPICQTYESHYGKTFDSLASGGRLRIEYRTRTFLDRNLKSLNDSKGVPESSKRAAIAAACADQVGRFQEYHDAAYAKAPEEEGDGYSVQKLRDEIAADAGITGDDLTTFQGCVDQNRTQTFVESVEQAGVDAQVNSTPTFMVNGKQVSFQNVDPTDEQAVLDVITSAAPA